MKTQLQKLLEDAYYFGLTPSEAIELTAAEMISFIEASRRRQLDEWKMLANAGYSAGMIGSMAFSRSRPRFEEIYNFPKEERTEDLDSHKAKMLAWAANENRRFRGKVKKDG